MLMLPPFTRPELNTIYHMPAESFLRWLPDGGIDLTVTSPPYDNLRQYKGFTWNFHNVARQLYRVTKPGGVVVWVVGDATVKGGETLTSMRQALYFVDTCGFLMHDTMVWEKDAPLLIRGTRRYAPVFEYMFVLSKGVVSTFNPIMRKNAHAGTMAKGSRRQRNGVNVQYKERSPVKEESILSNLWQIPAGYLKVTQDTYAYDHPAMFPESLAERHILTWSNAGDVVLDPFMGSGTTAKMAAVNRRNYIGCDISAEYVDLAKRRVSSFTPNMFEAI